MPGQCFVQCLVRHRSLLPAFLQVGDCFGLPYINVLSWLCVLSTHFAHDMNLSMITAARVPHVSPEGGSTALLVTYSITQGRQETSSISWLTLWGRLAC